MPLLGQDVKVIGPENEDQEGLTTEGKALFLLESFHGREVLGVPFRYDLTVLSEIHNIPAFGVLGQSLTISMDLGTRVRFFNGIVTYFAKVGFTKTHTRYALVLNPKLSRLDYARNCRIFKQASMSDQELDDGPAMQDTLSIATSVLLERDVAEVDNATESQGGKKNHVGLDRHYCVQYRETDLNFVQRLLEEEGIYYFFTHELGKHNMVLADSIGAHRSKAIAHDPILYLPKENNSAAPGEHFWSLTVAGSLYPGKYTVLRGYDPTQKRAPVPVPDAQVENELAGNPQPSADFEEYDYPGGLFGSKQAKEEALVRSEADRSANTIIEVDGNTMGVGVGDLVKFVQDANALDNPFWAQDDITAEYLVTSASYDFTINQHEAGDPGVSDEPFRARYTLIDSRLQYRPQRTAPKPRIEGPQTAVVVGAESGKPKDEIYTDKFGRVKVKFDWDRTPGGDMNSSCWVRVSQVWAGQNWGAIHIPRVGQEVIVEFLDGDPDRPIITGRVYNANNPPPYTLPDHRTQSGIKSRSTNEGTPNNFNEIRFEDLKGKEELHIQAEKTMSTLVKADQSNTIGGNRTSSITGKDTVTVEKDRVVNVTGSLFTFVDGSPNNGDFQSTHSVMGKHNLYASEEIIVQADNKIEFTCGSSKITMVPGTITLEIDGGGKIVLDANVLAQATGGKANIKLTDKVNLEAKDGSTLALDADAKLHGAGNTAVDAKTEATFTAGGSVKATKAGVEVTGTMVKLNG